MSNIPDGPIRMEDRSNAEILDILTYQHESRPDAVRAAMMSWEARRLSPQELVDAQKEMDAHRQVQARKAALVARIDRNAMKVWRGIKRVIPPWRRKRR